MGSRLLRWHWTGGDVSLAGAQCGSSAYKCRENCRLDSAAAAGGTAAAGATLKVIESGQEVPRLQEQVPSSPCCLAVSLRVP